jgi:hypothetical protein
MSDGSIIPTRRSLLGTLGAAALAGIAFPWKPNPTDIVLATELPPPPQKVTAKPVADIPDVTPGMTLYDHRGRPVAIATRISIDHDLIDVTTLADNGWRRMMPSGVMRGSLDADLILPAACVFGDTRYEVHPARHNCVVSVR